MVGTAFEFGMELNTYKKVVIRQLHSLHQPAVRRCAADNKPGVGKPFAVLVVEFPAVAVPLAYFFFAVCV